MKKILGSCLIGLALALGASAQTVPPGLIDNLHIVGIEKWEVVATNFLYISTYPNGGQKVLQYAIKESGLPPAETPGPTALYYIINMTAIVENAGDAGVLLKDPQFMVTILQPKEGAEVLGTGAGGGQLFKGPNLPRLEVPTELGMARLVSDRESQVWKPVARIPGHDEGAKSPKESPLQFEVVVGATDPAHAKKVFNTFNAMNNQTRRWALRLEGTGRVGWQSRSKGDSSAEIYSTEETEIILQSKPEVPDHISFLR
jgi:hypothetical protein